MPLFLGELQRRRAELRRLQLLYYTAPSKDEGAIRQYLQTLLGTRNEFVSHAGPAPRALHLGAGGFNIPGFVNSDLELASRPDIALDATRELPFRDESLDYIHSEDFLEHLPHEAGRRVLRECHRILKPRGVLRLLTPDLALLIKKVYLRKKKEHLRWCHTQLSSATPCEALNMHFRMNGDHQFIYDFRQLSSDLREAGFAVKKEKFHSSTSPFLRFLDLRDFGLNLIVEATKR